MYGATPAPPPDPRTRPRHGGPPPGPPPGSPRYGADTVPYDVLPYAVYQRDGDLPGHETQVQDVLPAVADEARDGTSQRQDGRRRGESRRAEARRPESRRAEARKAETRRAESRRAGSRKAAETQQDDPREQVSEMPEAAEVVLPRQADGGRARARRAARRRRTAERPAPLRRLVPQALVVAFLAGGTSAFVAKDKAIELNVDGEPRELHTFADDVTELLAREGVDVGAHDRVAPALGAPLTTGDEVAVAYGRPVRLTLDGQRRDVWTTARTVERALQQLGVRTEGAYVSTERARPIGRAGLALDVRTERTVTVMADGRARRIRTNAATVREAVEQAGITLEGQDTTSVPQESFPRDGQTITVLRIKGRKEVREEPIPFDVERTEDPSLFRGTEVVEWAGEPGVRRVTYSLRTVNGVRQKPRRLHSEMIRPPRTQVVKVGTKPLPSSVQGTDHLDWNGLAVCESGGRANAVDSSGTYGGLYQFDRRTWESLGGHGRPQDATADEQTYRAKKLYLERGASPWPHCGAELQE
ncbi:hypothetical protein GCM10017589_01490 [Streptomyces poonensis]|nr:hypothetical protein GCM10017589_01490 [Streptomyces poonensis]